MRLQKIWACDLTPGSPWSEGDMAPGPLAQEQLFEEYPIFHAIHSGVGWEHKQLFSWEPWFPDARRLANKSLEEWMLKPDKEVKTEEQKPDARGPGSTWLHAAASSTDPRQAPIIHRSEFCQVNPRAYDDATHSAVHRGPITVPEYVPNTYLLSLCGSFGSFNRHGTKKHTEAVVKEGIAVAIHGDKTVRHFGY